ncbi:hypothetical protein HZA57_02590 [Candidatus Poribacteria bacterium]|nr:hypothetical protein [Candidatus Poribacteria bacterium]
MIIRHFHCLLDRFLEQGVIRHQELDWRPLDNAVFPLPAVTAALKLGVILGQRYQARRIVLLGRQEDEDVEVICLGWLSRIEQGRDCTADRIAAEVARRFKFIEHTQGLFHSAMRRPPGELQVCRQELSGDKRNPPPREFRIRNAPGTGWPSSGAPK